MKDIMTAANAIEQIFLPDGSLVKGKRRLEKRFQSVVDITSKLELPKQLEVLRATLPVIGQLLQVQSTDPRIRTLTINRFASSCIPRVVISFFETQFSPMSSLHYKYRFLSGRVWDARDIFEIPEDRIDRRLNDTDIVKLDAQSVVALFDGDSVAQIPRPDRNTRAFLFRYQQSDHHYSCLQTFFFNSPLTDSNFDRICSIFRVSFLSNRLSMRPTLNMRSYFRHTVQPVISALNSGFDLYKKNHTVSDDGSPPSKLENELSRQFKNLLRVSSPFGEKPYREDWGLNPQDHFNDERRSPEQSVRPSNEDDIQYSIAQLLHDARRGSLLNTTGASDKIKVDIILPKNSLILSNISRRSLSEILSELLVNSRKYKVAGTATHIFFHLDRKGRPTIYVVNLTRPVPQAEKYRLVEAGVRASNLPEEATGTGQGLTRVKELCDRHGLRFRVEPAASSREPYFETFWSQNDISERYDLFSVRVGFKAEHVEVRGNDAT